MAGRTAGLSLLIGSVLLVTAIGVGCLWPVLTCPHCHGAGQFIMIFAPTDTMDGAYPGRIGSKCTLCMGRKRATLGQGIKYWITGHAPKPEPPFERYLLDPGS